MATFGEMLSELRRDKGLSQKELAGLLHVSVGTVSNYENDVHRPDLEGLSLLADLFEVTTDYLLGRCPDPDSALVLSQPIAKNRTAGDFLRAVRQLPQDRREALLLILDDMSFHAAVSRYHAGEEKK